MAKWDLSKLPEGRKPLPDEWFAERAQMQERIKGLEELLWAAENDANEAEAYAGELEAKLAKALEGLDRVMVGGNHLATILPDNFPPAETEPLIALETMGYGHDFEVWCGWRSIMLARTTLAELTGGKDE